MEDQISTWLSPAQAAARLGISSQRVRQLVQEGQLTGVRTTLGHLIDPASVAALAATRSRRVAPVGVPW